MAQTSVGTDPWWLGRESDWTILWPKPDGTEKVLPDEVAPAVAWQYRVDLELKIELPAFGVGWYAGMPWADARDHQWAFRVFDPARNVSGDFGSDNPEEWTFGEEDDSGGYYHDSLSGLHDFLGILASLGAGVYLLQWTYGNEAMFIEAPNPCQKTPAWLGSEALAGPVGEMGGNFLSDLAYVTPAQDAAAIAGSWTIGMRWHSPVLWATIPAGAHWSLNFSSSFDAASWSLRMRRIPVGGFGAYLSPDELVHALRPTAAGGTSALEEAISGLPNLRRRRGTPLDGRMPNVVRDTDGSLHVLTMRGGTCYFVRSRDEGTTWDPAVAIPGKGIPMDIARDNDGRLHAVRVDGRRLFHEVFSRFGRLVQRRTVGEESFLSADLLVEPSGSILVRGLTGREAVFFRSRDGGNSWEVARRAAYR